MHTSSDTFVDRHGLKRLVPYSRSHVDRLEKAGQFPKRIKIGPGRIVWSSREVLDWIESKRSA